MNKLFWALLLIILGYSCSTEVSKGEENIGTKESSMKLVYRSTPKSRPLSLGDQDTLIFEAKLSLNGHQYTKRVIHTANMYHGFKPSLYVLDSLTHYPPLELRMHPLLYRKDTLFDINADGKIDLLFLKLPQGPPLSWPIESEIFFSDSLGFINTDTSSRLYEYYRMDGRRFLTRSHFQCNYKSLTFWQWDKNDFLFQKTCFLGFTSPNRCLCFYDDSITGCEQKLLPAQIEKGTVEDLDKQTKRALKNWGL